MMSKKWFNKRQEIVPPVSLDGYPSDDDLRGLLLEMERRDVPNNVYKLFRKLAFIPPSIRLSLNIKTLMDRLAVGHVGSVLADGLAPAELSALLSIKQYGLSQECVVTAYSLLNIGERFSLIGELSSHFVTARSLRSGYLSDEE